MLLLGTCINGNMFFFGVCSNLFKSNPSLGNLLLLGTCVGIVFFVCVVICLRAFSWELASVVDFFGVIYLRSSLFRSLLLEISSGKNKFSVFLGSSLGKFGFIEYLDGVVCFFLYIFFCSYVFYFSDIHYFVFWNAY